VGCIPSKALLASSEMFESVQHDAAHFHAQLRRANRSDVATGPGTDHNQIKGV